MAEHEDGRSSRAAVQSKFSALWAVYSRMSASFWILLVLSTLTMLVAFPVSSILFRLYYVNGGSHRWLLTWVGSAGWPLPAIILLLVYPVRGIAPTRPTWTLLLAYAVIGFLSAADNFMFAWSYAYLPASTSTLLASSSLAFTAIFAWLLVHKKLNASSVNSIAIMTAGAVILGLDSSSDRPPGTTSRQYLIGFVLDVAGSALHGLIFVLSELVFVKLLDRRVGSAVHLVLELQVVTSIFACLFTVVGVIASGDFGDMGGESQAFKHGPVAYYMVLVWASVSNQLGVLAGVAVLYLTSALFAGVLNAARVPLTAVAAVLCFGDNMSGFKVMSILLTIWSFGSYVYGGFVEEAAQQHKQNENDSL
ncbi:probable purine permease 5 [Selaginella moellendorffii]|nr:probable purine permease 5 [Selaginella moellendorffii]|eukprot:XP_002961495.2 probable purine permease 5 [Selaginella moellendorffii]